MQAGVLCLTCAQSASHDESDLGLVKAKIVTKSRVGWLQNGLAEAADVGGAHDGNPCCRHSARKGQTKEGKEYVDPQPKHPDPKGMTFWIRGHMFRQAAVAVLELLRK